MNKFIISLLIVASLFYFITGCTNSSNKTEDANKIEVVNETKETEGDNKSEGTIDIFDARKKDKPIPYDLSHFPYDIEIDRTTHMGEEGYEVKYYQIENGSLANHFANVGLTEDYDKADYKWLNDTMVYIRLFNAQTQEEFVFKAFGNGLNSGLIVD